MIMSAMAWGGLSVCRGCGPHSLSQLSLYESAQQGDIAGVKRHLKMGADVDERGQEGWTALMVAVYRGDVAMARLLLKRAADVNARNIHGVTVLMVAIHRGQREMERLLVEHGADVNAQTPAGRSSLMFAVRKGDIRIVDDLLTRGADVTVVDQAGGSIWTELSRLQRRTGYARPDIVEKLEDYGAIQSVTALPD